MQDVSTAGIANAALERKLAEIEARFAGPAPDISDSATGQEKPTPPPTDTRTGRKSAAPPAASDTAKPAAETSEKDAEKKKNPFLEMSVDEIKEWVASQCVTRDRTQNPSAACALLMSSFGVLCDSAKRKESRYAGLERALRESLIKEGVLPPSAIWEDQKDDPSMTVELCIEEEFDRSFTEPALGLALNVGKRGAIVVKRCVPGSPAASRRIPPGVELMSINEEALQYPSLKEVQTTLQKAERPVKLHFRQTEASLALAHASVRAVRNERDEHVRKLEEAKARYEEEMRPAEIETAEAFERTFAEGRLGLCLKDASTPSGVRPKRRRTVVFKCLPRAPAWKSGLPEGAIVVSVNGKSVEFRRFKEVKKIVELAQRPVTIAFSTADEPVFPPTIKKSRKIPSDAAAVPAYARKPV